MEHTVVRLARQAAERRYGKYRGFVVDNADPQKRARLKLRVPSVLGEQESDWALPCLPFGGFADQGLFAVPVVDAQVWVEFEEGDLHRPLWVGTFWQAEADVPAPAALSPPTTRLLRTPSGHTLQFDDEADAEKITLFHPKEATLVIDPDGAIALTDAKGAKLTLDAAGERIVLEDSNGNSMTMSSSGVVIEDANGNKVEMASSGIKVKGQQVVIEGSQVMLGGSGGEPVIKGTSFLSLFATHMHPTAMGPSGPPIPQGEMSSLSSKVMTA
jgi:uncharacterized protein involved in type VI secretion and phage assembly